MKAPIRWVNQKHAAIYFENGLSGLVVIFTCWMLNTKLFHFLFGSMLNLYNCILQTSLRAWNTMLNTHTRTHTYIVSIRSVERLSTVEKSCALLNFVFFDFIKWQTHTQTQTHIVQVFVFIIAFKHTLLYFWLMETRNRIDRLQVEKELTETNGDIGRKIETNANILKNRENEEQGKHDNVLSLFMLLHSTQITTTMTISPEKKIVCSCCILRVRMNGLKYSFIWL